MILKASQRAGGNQLAAHLLNDRDNEHVTIHELRGFIADDLHGAFQEAHAISQATQCKQYLFSVSFNPPKGVLTEETDFTRAADEAEKRLGLTGQPRAIVFHEKEGRRHAHVVWSRIDAEQLKAVNLPFFKRKLTDLSRDLFLEHEWTLPDGLRTHGGKSPLNFTLAEWQQAKRLGRDPREIKDAIRDCWQRSDNAKALSNALEERGYFLAQGDRRGFVVVDTDGEVFALARYAGLKTRDVRDKLGDPSALPTVSAIKADLAQSTSRQLSAFIGEARQRQAREINEAKAALLALARAQRAERRQLHADQSARERAENKVRAERFRRGLPGLWDTLTGRKQATRKQNEAELVAALARDRGERDALARTQMTKRDPLQKGLDTLRARHANDRKLLARDMSAQRRRLRGSQSQNGLTPPGVDQPSRKRRGLTLDL